MVFGLELLGRIEADQWIDEQRLIVEWNYGMNKTVNRLEDVGR